MYECLPYFGSCRHKGGRDLSLTVQKEDPFMSHLNPRTKLFSHAIVKAIKYTRILANNPKMTFVVLKLEVLESILDAFSKLK